MDQWNPEWLNSRLQKLLTKNIAMLYFGLTLSADDTSLLSGAVDSGMEIDRMSGEVIEEDGAWESFTDSGDPGFTVYDSPKKAPLWRPRRSFPGSRFCAGEFLDVNFAFAAEIYDFHAGEKRPVGDYTSCGGAFCKFRVADCIRLGSANGRDQAGR
jgi:hypothetical protein